MVTCVSCGEDIRLEASFCLRCGATQTPNLGERDTVEGDETVLSAEEQQESADALREAYLYAGQQLTFGASTSDITKELVNAGWEQDVADQLVVDAQEAVGGLTEQYKESPEGRSELASKYARHMGYGLLWMIGGAAVAGYAAAWSVGVYVVAWGAIVFGAIDFIIGFAGWLRYRN